MALKIDEAMVQMITCSSTELPLLQAKAQAYNHLYSTLSRDNLPEQG